jgi:transposase
LDAAQLLQIPEHLRKEVGAVIAKADWLEMQVRLLKEQLRLERIRTYCPSAEGLSDAQLLLLELEPSVSLAEVLAESALAAEIKAATPMPEPAPVPVAKVPVRKPLPAHLERVEKIIHCSEADCRCAQCEGQKKVIGYEVSEQLSIKPLEYFVEVTKREKLACPKCEELGVTVAPVPVKIVEKGICSNELIIDAVVAKYCDHKPLYRQAAAIKRDAAIEISPATLGNGVMSAGALLIPVCKVMRQELLADDYIQADETPVPVQDPQTKGKNHRAYIWEYSRPGGPVIFDFQMGREREGPKNFLGNYQGALQTDGYAGYEKVGGSSMEHFGCWSHARRKFSDAAKVAPKDVRPVKVLKKIGELYAVEAQAREAGLGNAEREAVRKEKSQPLLVELKALFLDLRQEALPQSTLAKACDYALNRWDKLEKYAMAGNGRIEICNNWCENGIRPITLGRKNWLHIGSQEAGPKACALMGIIETCKRIKINVRQYLASVMPQLADRSTPTSRIKDLTPMKWKSAQTNVRAK